MKIQVADSKDNPKLVDFFKSFLIKSNFIFKIDRYRDFFAPYEVQSEEHLTYQLKDEDGKIEGIATFVVNDVLIQGKPERIAFARDLRISSNRQAILSWAQHFLPVMSEITHTLRAKYFFSVMSMADIQALNAFVRPKSNKRPLPHYHLFRRFNLVSVHGRLPWASKPLKHLRIRRGAEGLKPKLIEYISKKSAQKDLARVWNEETFNYKLERWPNLKIEDFLIAIDKDENIVGCVAPWCAGNMQDLIPLEYSIVAHNFRQFLKFGKLFGWTRTLTKPFRKIKIEAGLNFKYLNFLFADNADIFETLLSRCYEDAKENEFLLYTQPRSEYILRRPKFWITANHPFAIYALIPPDSELPEFLRPYNSNSIDLDPFFVI